MTSKLITKIKNRPSYYYFDTAIKDNKKITVKYCLFTEDLYKDKAIALKIKNTVDSRIQGSIQKNKPIFYDSSLKNQIRKIKLNKK